MKDTVDAITSSNAMVLMLSKGFGVTTFKPFINMWLLFMDIANIFLDKLMDNFYLWLVNM